MRGDEAAPPLGARPVFRVTELDSLAEELWTGYGARLSRGGRGASSFFASANRAQIGAVQLHYCRYDEPVEIQFADMTGVRQIYCLSGHGRISSNGRQVDIDVSTTAIIPGSCSFQAAYDANYRHLVAQFDEDILRRKAEAITGSSAGAAPAWPGFQPLEIGARRHSREIVAALGRILALEPLSFDVPLQEMGQALSSAFLIENMPGMIERLAEPPKAASGSSVRVLEDYIHANWNRPLTAEEIAAACGVSVRSVFARFREQRGTAPLTYIRDLRLDHARAMLLSATEDMSVIAVAIACGFASFGHFARRYRERFGELPSTTRARGLGA